MHRLVFEMFLDLRGSSFFENKCHANKSELRIVDVWLLRIYICGHWKLRPITSSPTLSSFPLRRRTSHFWYIAEENKLYLDDILYPSRSCFLISQNFSRNRSLVIFHLSRQVGVRSELLIGKLYINRTYQDYSVIQC